MLETNDLLLGSGLTPPDGQWEEHDDDAAQTHAGPHEVEAGAGVPRHVHQTPGQDWSEEVREGLEEPGQTVGRGDVLHSEVLRQEERNHEEPASGPQPVETHTDGNLGESGC